jgi:hypothetical protein
LYLFIVVDNQEIQNKDEKKSNEKEKKQEQKDKTDIGTSVGSKTSSLEDVSTLSEEKENKEEEESRFDDGLISPRLHFCILCHGEIKKEEFQTNKKYVFHKLCFDFYNTVDVSPSLSTPRFPFAS